MPKRRKKSKPKGNGSPGSKPCPMCKAKPQKIPEETEPFNFDYYGVTCPGDDTIISFKEATTTYLEQNFPHLDEGFYRVPEVSLDMNEELDFVKDDEVHEFVESTDKVDKGQVKQKGPVTSEKILEDRKSRKAVQEVANAMSDVDEILKPCFVLFDFNFLQFLKHVPLSKSEKEDLYQLDGDHDILVISRKLGIIFVQVKSVQNGKTTTCRSACKKAFEQIEKDKLAMKHMNADLDFISSVSMKGFVGVPNLTDEDVKCICENHRPFILTQSDLKLKFRERLLPRDSLQNHALCEAQYRLLVSRYVGLASSVELRTISEAVDTVGRRVSRIILNPQQLKCLKDDPRRNVILGDYGTGKSLLLMKKAKEVAEKVSENGGMVYVINFGCISEFSEYFTSKNYVDPLVDHLEGMDTNRNNNLIIRSLIDHLEAVGHFKDKASFTIGDTMTECTPDSNVHYFFDEFPLTLLKDKGWERIENLCKQNESMYVWIAISAWSSYPGKDESFRDHENSGVLKGKLFEKTYLERTMRTTIKCFNLIQEIRQLKDEHMRKPDSHGNVIEGTKPWWVELSPCSCTGLQNPFKCVCVGANRMKKALNEILNRLSTISKNDFTVLINNLNHKMTRFLIRVMENACEEASISYKLTVNGVVDRFCKDGDPKKAINMWDLASYKGNESKVVIFVDPYGGALCWGPSTQNRRQWPDITLAASRSLAEFIIITWPNEEKRFFNEDFIDCCWKCLSEMVEKCPLEKKEPRQDEPSLNQDLKEFLRTLVTEMIRKNVPLEQHGNTCLNIADQLKGELKDDFIDSLQDQRAITKIQF